MYVRLSSFLMFGLISTMLSMSCDMDAQALPVFPDDWLGVWEGELRLGKHDDTTVRKFAMTLQIQETDTAGTWDWIITYGEGEQADVREYSLVAKDSSYTHFVIDEHNSIILDQYRIGNRMYSRFSVDSTDLTVIYRLEGDVLESEMWSGKTTGTRTGENIPEEEGSFSIFTYPLKVVQLSRLIRKR